MKLLVIIIIVLGCVYGRGIPKKPNSKRNDKDKPSVANIDPPEKLYIPAAVAGASPAEKSKRPPVAGASPAEKSNKKESISSINMKHGIISDIVFKDGDKDKLPNLWIKPSKHPRVPYVFEFSDRDYIKVIKEAIKELNSLMKNYSCASYPPVWQPRTTESDYVAFTNKRDGGCWSRLGKIGGRQELNIGKGCNYKDTVLHEMLHAMGFLHEQSRCDRDTAVEIVYDNIKPSLENQFDIDTTRSSYTSKYDIWSIMQYDLWAFSRKKSKTEETKTIKVLDTFLELTEDEEKEIGNPPTLSDTDKLELSIMYGCLASTCTVGCDGVEICPDEHSTHDNLKDTIKHSSSDHHFKTNKHSN